MTMKLDGIELSNKIAKSLQGSFSEQDRLAIVQIGSNDRSESYTKKKAEFGNQIGVSVQRFILGLNFSTNKIIEEIKALQKEYLGVMIQLPLPERFTELDVENILVAIDPEYDVDCLNPKQKNNLVAPVAGAVDIFLKETCVDLYSAETKIVVLGKGKTVGLPVCEMLDAQNISYDVLDKDTDSEYYAKILADATVVISGVGKPHFIKSNMIREGVILIDAGISFLEGNLCGDIDPDCYSKARFYTPVPGGVGPLGIAVLFQNLKKLSEEKSFKMVQ